MDRGAWWVTKSQAHSTTYQVWTHMYGLPWWLSGEQSTCQRRRREFNPWVETIPWKRKWKPILVFLPGIPGTEEPGRLQSVGGKRVKQYLATRQQQQSYASIAIRVYTCNYTIQFSSVQSLSRVQLFATPWTTARQASLTPINFWSLLKLISIELVMPSNHLILCHPLLLPPSIFPSIRIFSNKSTLRMRWPEYWSFSFNISFQ